MKVFTNCKGSGDWVKIIDDDGDVLFEGHRITPQDMVDLINNKFGGVGLWKEFAVLVEVTDKQMEEV